MGKIDWSAVWESVVKHKKLLMILGLVLLALLGFFFLQDRVGDWWANRKEQKTKDRIANSVQQIQEIKQQVSQLEGRKEEIQGQIVKDHDELMKQVEGREEDKKATNSALANFNKAMNANTDVNRTAEDLIKQVGRLEE